MKVINWITLLAAFIMMTGCATVQTPTKHAQQNTIYSSKIPEMNIQVDDSFTFQKEKRETHSPGNDEKIGSKRSNLQTKYFYEDTQQNRGFLVTFSNMLDRRWHFGGVNFNTKENLSTGSVILKGDKYITRIYTKVGDNGTFLLKQYHCTFSGHCRINIYYRERLESNISNSSHLSNEDNAYVADFDKRADASFTILPYSPSI